MSITPSSSAAEACAVTADTVMASMLVASPGAKVFQAAGHAAIRLQSPRHGLDNVFSYETDYRGGLAGQLLGQAKGRYIAMTFSDYLAPFEAEGREIKSYPLNLTDAQIRRLWQLLDMSVAEAREDDFNMRRNQCNSQALDKLQQALGAETIHFGEHRLSLMDNGTFVNAVLHSHSPWAELVAKTGLGADCDVTDSWHTRLQPVAMGTYFADAEIVSPDGSRRPLLAAAPYTVLAADKIINQSFTPLTVSLLLLLVVALVSGADLANRCGRVVRVADVALLWLQTFGAFAVIAIAVIPASVGPWANWMFVPLNPLPAAVWLLCKSRPKRRKFFVAYGCACAVFIAAPLWTSEASASSSILSASIALRVLTHYLKPDKPIKSQ